MTGSYTTVKIRTSDDPQQAPGTVIASHGEQVIQVIGATALYNLRGLNVWRALVPYLSWFRRSVRSPSLALSIANHHRL